MSVRDSYDSAARAYADHLFTELEQKPLDRHLLNRFAEDTRDRGLVVDLGCGPGHVSKYLREQGVSVIGVDLSAEMIRVAGHLSPEIDFRVGDMCRLDFDDASLAGVVAFYSIVHFDSAELGAVFREMHRVLRQDGLVLISFHIGDQVLHVEDLFGVPVSLDFRFHIPGEVIEALRRAHFHVVEKVEREPYAGAEYPSRRCYLLARAAESQSEVSVVARPAFPEELEREISAGRLWRVKEILQGRISGRGFDPRLYEQLGFVLLQMGDLLEAGKFLTLAGVLEPEYDAAITLFKERNGRRHWTSVLGQFPASARSVPFSELPPNTQQFLRDRGYPETRQSQVLSRAFSEVQAERSRKRSRRDKWKGPLGCGCFLFILMVIGYAAMTGLPILVDRFFR